MLLVSDTGVSRSFLLCFLFERKILQRGETERSLSTGLLPKGQHSQNLADRRLGARSCFLGLTLVCKGSKGWDIFQCFSRSQAEAASEMEQPGHKLVPIWDVGAIRWRINLLDHCAALLASPGNTLQLLGKKLLSIVNN